MLTRQGVPDRVPFYELFSNIEGEVLDVLGLAPEPAHMDRDEPGYHEWLWRRRISYMYALGYDYATGGVINWGFPRKERPQAMTAQGERAYYTADLKTIANRDDFEQYPWPVISDIDYSLLEDRQSVLPDGMKVIGTPCNVAEASVTSTSPNPNGTSPVLVTT